MILKRLKMQKCKFENLIFKNPEMSHLLTNHPLMTKKKSTHEAV